MRILVIGGTRFIGRRAAELAADAGHDVAVLSRGHHPPPARARHIALDRARLDDLHETFDAVLDNVARHDRDVRQALPLARRRYVLTSTMSVYPHWDARTPTRWRERDFDPAAPWPSVPIEYVQGKRLAEAAVVSESKVEWAVVRPALVMGAGDSTGRTDYWCRPAFDIPREWDRLEFTFAWVDDVARALLAAAADPRAAGGTFNVAHDEPLTLESFFAAFGRPVEYREVDPGADPPPLVNGTLDVSQARERLGWTPTPLASWLPPLVDVNISRDRT